MTSTSPQPESVEEAVKTIARLERRLHRERTARASAEIIADRGMRDLWMANRDLDERVAERTKELESALEKLEAATVAGAAFISNLSHEMITPLNGVIGMLEMLHERAHNQVTKDYITTALRSGERLSNLLARLLDLLELRSGRLKPKTVETSLSKVAEHVNNKWRVDALKSRGLLTVRTSSDRTFWVDEHRLCQILDELVSNAIVHGDSGVIEVDLSIAADATHLQATVKDPGPGFAPRQQDDFWATFLKADLSPNRATEGAGIGLGLADRLAIVLGGELDLRSSPGQPTEAVAILPIHLVN